MVPWSFLSVSLTDCAFCIITNEGLIRKIYLPKLIFPLTRVLINLTTLVLSMVALFLLLKPLGARFSLPLVVLPVVIVLFSAFTLGLGLIVATTNTFFRDCGHLVAGLPPGVVLRDADHLRPRPVPKDRALAVLAEPGVPVHPAVPGDHLRRPVAAVDVVLGGRRHCDGEPGGRLCRIQGARRQVRLPPLGDPAGASGGRPRPGALVELRDVSLRFVSYFDKQYSLKRAALDLLLRREAPAPSSAFWALRDVSLRIAKGERVGVIGANGAGKSTLLRLLARIYPPTSGALAVRGTVAPLIEMGAGFNPELSGTDNILLNGAMLGFSRREMQAKVEGIHEFTGLREFADLPLKYYSSGMYMRLAFAIATEVDPDILLIDESLGAGDAAFLDKAKARILGLLDRSNVVIIVSHDLPALREICTRGIWMRKGRVAGDGPIDEVIDRYLEDVGATRAG